MPEFNYLVEIASENNGNTSEKMYSEKFEGYNKVQLSQFVINHEYPFDVKKIIDCFQDKKECIDEGLGEIITDALSIISTVSFSENKFTYKKNELVNFFEYYKLFIQDIKFDYSLLLNTQISENIIEGNSELTAITFSFLDYIKQQYNIIINSSSLSKQVEECLNSVQILFTHKIKMILNPTKIRVTNNFLGILSGPKLSSKYYYGPKCFALAFKGSFYYAVSGYDYQNPNPQIETLGKQIVGALVISQPVYCITSDKTPSYGYLNSNMNFVEYDTVICHGNGSNPSRAQYSCCERKILPNIEPEQILGYFYKLRIIVKYAPCIDCSLALTKAANQYLHGLEIKFFFNSRKEFTLIKNNILTWIKDNTNNGEIVLYKNY